MGARGAPAVASRLRTTSRASGSLCTSAPAQGGERPVTCLARLRAVRWLLSATGLLGGAHWTGQPLPRGLAQASAPSAGLVAVVAVRVAGREGCAHERPSQQRAAHPAH